MAARPIGVWGIDLGQCALKAIRLEMKDGQAVATAFEYIEHAKILSQPDADPDELTRDALNQFLERNKIKGDLVTISVPGQSGLARFVKLPPVDEKKIADIVKFEAKQQIPFPLEEVVWDFQRLNRGDIIDGMALETEIGLFAMKRDMVLRALQQFKEVNVEVHIVQMAPLALCNFVSYDLLGKGAEGPAEDGEAHECIVCLEIGTDSSNLVITDGGRIIWQRPIPIGGNHFTRALTKEMKLTFAKAEHLKRNASKSPELKKILSALKLVLNDFVGEVQRSLGYFTNTHRNAQIQYMIGLGNAFRLPGLQKFLQEKLQLEVRKLQHMERVSGDAVTAAPTFAENIMSFGVAYGLALQGLKQAHIQTNLLPHEVRFERVIRGKKPWAVAAAAALVFGMFMMAFARGMEKSAIDSVEITQEKAKAEAIAKQLSDLTAAYNAEEAKLTASRETMRRIAAGVPERMNWQYLHEFINMASPQPNGGRLVERNANSAIKAKYWNDSAKKAWVELQEKLFAKRELDAKATIERDLDIKKNLIQINIHGINALYTDDFTPYFRKLMNDKPYAGLTTDERGYIDALLKEPEEAKRKMMKDIPQEGWLVEVRGYTYHHKGYPFVEETLIENLRNPGNVRDPTLPKEMQDQIKQVQDQIKVSFLNIYKQEAVKNPAPGQFKLISQSWLRQLVKGDPAPGQPGVVGQPPPVLGQPNPNAKPSRDPWKAIGEAASATIDGSGAAAAVGAPPPPETKGAPPPVERTEFVLVFIWQEPLNPTPPPSIVAADKKN